MISITSLGIILQSSTLDPSSSKIIGAWFWATARSPGNSRKTTGFLTKSITSFSKDNMGSSLMGDGVLGVLGRCIIHAQLCRVRILVFWGLELGLEGWKLCSPELFLRGISTGSSVDDSFFHWKNKCTVWWGISCYEIFVV